MSAGLQSRDTGAAVNNDAGVTSKPDTNDRVKMARCTASQPVPISVSHRFHQHPQPEAVTTLSELSQNLPARAFPPGIRKGARSLIALRLGMVVVVSTPLPAVASAATPKTRRLTHLHCTRYSTRLSGGVQHREGSAETGETPEPTNSTQCNALKQLAPHNKA